MERRVEMRVERVERVRGGWGAVHLALQAEEALVAAQLRRHVMVLDHALAEPVDLQRVVQRSLALLEQEELDGRGKRLEQQQPAEVQCVAGELGGVRMVL